MTVQIKNVSVYGDLDVPALRRYVPAGAVIEIADPELAESLIAGGHFQAVESEPADAPADAPAEQADDAPTEQPADEPSADDTHTDDAAENGSEQH